MRLVRVSGDRDPAVLEASVDDVSHLNEVLQERACVHVVTNDALEALLHAGVRMQDHGWKKDPSGLSHYLLKKQRKVQGIRTRYNSLRRFLDQGIPALLNGAARQDCAASFLVGVPDVLFEGLLAAAAGETTPAPDDSGCEEGDPQLFLLSKLPDIPAPERVDLESRFRGESVDAQIVRRLIPIVARQEDPVLILGETGTGKGIVARAIHDCSERGGTGPFITVNCGAVPTTLFESDLYGYAPGAFTGALKEGQIGLWEKANGGTLFLDEIADLPLECQPKILHALQDKIILRVGEGKERAVNARVIAATCQDLFQRVEQGLFREDLFYRLRRFMVRTPGLRESADFLPALIQQFWRDVTDDEQGDLSPTVVDLLTRQQWGGNHRDLKGFLRDLNGTWPEEPIQSGHIKALLIQRGPSPVLSHKGPTNSLAAEVRRLDCQQHLNHAAEVLHAVQNALEPLAERQAPIPPDLATALDHRLIELDRLVASPLRFGNDTAYTATADVQAGLARLNTLLADDEPRARALCRKETRSLIKKALGVLFEAV
jgi:Sigma-54 interaction domain